MTRRIHIVGVSPRTGTTLLAECMVACFHIDAFEPHEAPLSAHRPAAQIYLTKRPGELRAAGTALETQTNLHVICMLRNPRDVIVSRHAGDPTRYWAPLRFWKSQIGDMRRFAHHERFMIVRYEELVSDPDGVQRKIAHRMPFLQPKAPFSSFHRLAAPSKLALTALGSLRPITGDSVGQWRRHLPRVAGQLKLHGSISAELIEFGYEPDESWLSLLDGITPDLSPSHWPEFRSPGPAAKPLSRTPQEP